MKVDLELHCSDLCLDQLLSLASFLDPRFKLCYVGDQESVLEEVKEQLTQLVPESETEGAIVAAAGNVRFWTSVCRELQHSLDYHLKRKFNKSLTVILAIQ